MVQAGDGGSFVHRQREVLRCIRQGAVTGGDRKRERTARAGSWGAAERGRTGPVVNEGNAARETPTLRQGGIWVARSFHSERACLSHRESRFLVAGDGGSLIHCQRKRLLRIGSHTILRVDVERPDSARAGRRSAADRTRATPEAGHSHDAWKPSTRTIRLSNG